MLLHSEDLALRRSPTLELRFPDISIERGQTLFVLGPSGTGKTTLLCMLAGLLRPSRGQVMYEGQDVYALSGQKRDALRGAHYGFVFQTLHLLPSLTMRQNIALASDMAGLKTDEARVDTLIQNLGLSDKAERKPEALSQGEMQRAAIARAVLNRPSIILADEPTSALDDRNAENVMTLLSDQAKDSGAALLIATHDGRLRPYMKNVIELKVEAA